MKKSFFVLMMFAILFFNACEKKSPCPLDASLGNKTLTTSSKLFMPYPNQSVTLIFKSAKNDSIKIKTIVQEYNPLRINDSLICGDGIDPSNSQYLYHDSEQILRGFNYNTTATNIDLLLRLYVDFVKDTIFYDKLIVRSSSKNIISNMELITDTRNNTFSTGQLSVLNQNRFVADTTWNGKNFKNVYYSVPNKTDNSAVFYNKQFGIVGLRITDDMWIFDRFE
jgi:hypothetical protein